MVASAFCPSFSAAVKVARRKMLPGRSCQLAGVVQLSGFSCAAVAIFGAWVAPGVWANPTAHPAMSAAVRDRITHGLAIECFTFMPPDCKKLAVLTHPFLQMSKQKLAGSQPCLRTRPRLAMEPVYAT